MTETTPEPTEKLKSLTAADRCDRCGAQAFVMATGVTGNLLFCAHHFVKHEEAVRKFAYEIADERDQLDR